jgi:hypothetical protein
VAGNGPAFSALLSANQTISGSTATLTQFAYEEFDTNSCFNNTGSTVGGIPAYAFKPNVAGYYLISASVYPSTATTDSQALIYKNGAVAKRQFTTGSNAVIEVTALIQLDGVSDYVQCYAQFSGTTPTISSAANLTYFQASMVRAA